MLAPLPDAHVAWGDRRLYVAWLALLAAAALNLATLPRLLVNNDEVYYAGQAHTLAAGRLLPVDGDPLPVEPGHAELAVRVPPGWPALLALGRSLRGMFMIALAAHLVGAAAFARLLVRRGLPALGVLAFLFHPLFFSFGRTLLADEATVAALLLAMDAWEERRPAGALAVGAALLLRFAAVVALAGFLLAVAEDVRGRRRLLLAGVAAVAAALLTMALLHRATFGAFGLTTPWASHNTTLFGTSLAWRNTALYLGGLLAVPPLSLLWLVVAPQRCDRWARLALPVLLFFVFYEFHDGSTRWWEALLGGQRLILPAHAALLVATARVWTAPLTRGPAVAWIACGLVVGTVGVMATRHLAARYQPAVDALARCAPRRLGFDLQSSRVALSVPAAAYLRVEGRERDLPVDVAITAARRITSHYEIEGESGPPPALAARGAVTRVGDFWIVDVSGRCPAR
jgi:hypothetical protein